MAFSIEFSGCEVYADDDSSDRYLGDRFGRGKPTAYVINGDFIIIRFSNGATRRIPIHRLIAITES